MKTKTTFTLITALALCISVRAVNSELSISSADNSRFVLTIDNFYFGTPSTTFNVTNLDPGYHRVRVQKQGVLVNGRSIPMEMVYDGYMNIPADAKVTAVSAGSGVMNIISIVQLYIANNWGYDPWGSGGSGNGTGTSNTGNGNGGYGWFPPIPQGMLQTDFDALKASIASKPFESTKMLVAAQALQSNRVTARQVKELMDLMTFESTKLDLAKAAYGRVVDRNNYYLVNDAFSFSNSSSELAQYLNAFPG